MSIHDQNADEPRSGHKLTCVLKSDDCRCHISSCSKPTRNGACQHPAMEGFFDNSAVVPLPTKNEVSISPPARNVCNGRHFLPLSGLQVSLSGVPRCFIPVRLLL